MTTPVKRFLVVSGVMVMWLALAAVVGNVVVIGVPVDNADVIVVLSGSAEYRQRARTAARLWQQETATKILITNDGRKGGWDQGMQRNPAYFELTKRTLEAEGVPPEQIFVIPGIVDGTYDEASLIIGYLRRNGIDSAHLVTSGFHTHRTLLAFHRIAGREGIGIRFGISCPDTDNQFSARWFWWLSKSGWRNIPIEVLKLGYSWWAY